MKKGTWFTFCLHLFQSSCLLQWYTAPSACAILEIFPGSPFLQVYSAPSAIQAGSLPWLNGVPSYWTLIWAKKKSREKKTATNSVFWRHCEWVAMMEHPIATMPQWRWFAPKVFPHTPQNVMLELCIDDMMKPAAQAVYFFWQFCELCLRRSILTSCTPVMLCPLNTLANQNTLVISLPHCRKPAEAFQGTLLIPNANIMNWFDFWMLWWYIVFTQTLSPHSEDIFLYFTTRRMSKGVTLKISKLSAILWVLVLKLPFSFTRNILNF